MAGIVSVSWRIVPIVVCNPTEPIVLLTSNRITANQLFYHRLELSSFHSALGVWDTVTDTKFSIQFVPYDWLACVFPTFDAVTQSLAWNNTGRLVVRRPLLTSDWTNGEARLVATASGVAYR